MSSSTELLGRHEYSIPDCTRLRTRWPSVQREGIQLTVEEYNRFFLETLVWLERVIKYLKEIKEI